MTQASSKLGREGEKAAIKFLKKNGYRIIEKNFRTHAGEIDIIAELEKVLVFVEVKTRSGSRLGHPVEALTPHKQKKIAGIASGFLAKHNIQDRECRFDVVSILGNPETPKDWKIELIQDVFRV